MLKKLAAILFLFILVFNFFGYRLVISFLQNNSDVVLEKRMDDKDFSNNELISIKTKLHLPYYNSSAEYERINGSINIDGVEYNYVQRRVYQDTLELLCLPNHSKTKLKAACNDIAKSSADGAASTPFKKTGNVLKGSFSDLFYYAMSNSTPCFAVSKPFYFSSNTILELSGYTLRQEKPPQQMQVIS